jgi:hypothetical protein
MYHSSRHSEFKRIKTPRGDMITAAIAAAAMVSCSNITSVSLGVAWDAGAPAGADLFYVSIASRPGISSQLT